MRFACTPAIRFGVGVVVVFRQSFSEMHCAAWNDLIQVHRLECSPCSGSHSAYVCECMCQSWLVFRCRASVECVDSWHTLPVFLCGNATRFRVGVCAFVVVIPSDRFSHSAVLSRRRTIEYCSCAQKSTSQAPAALHGNDYTRLESFFVSPSDTVKNKRFLSQAPRP